MWRPINPVLDLVPLVAQFSTVGVHNIVAILLAD
jgi:hypothetical protein